MYWRKRVKLSAVCDSLQRQPEQSCGPAKVRHLTPLTKVGILGTVGILCLRPGAGAAVTDGNRPYTRSRICWAARWPERYAPATVCGYFLLVASPAQNNRPPLGADRTR